MKYIQLFILTILPMIIFAEELPKCREERIQETAKEGYNLIDTIFENAQDAVKTKVLLMDEHWLKKQKEINDYRNLISDSEIISFDENAINPVPEMLYRYLESKINEKNNSIFEIDDISVKRLEDFYEFSCLMCKLSGGKHCRRMIENIKKEHFDDVLKLKLRKVIREELQKERVSELRDAFLFGGHR